MPDYGRNPYLGSSGGRYRPPVQKYRRKKRGSYNPNRLNYLIGAAAVVIVAVVVICLIPKGTGAIPAGGTKNTAAPNRTAVGPAVTAQQQATQSPAPADGGATQQASQTTASPTATPSGSSQTDVSGAPPPEGFTGGDVLVKDYQNPQRYLYQSQDLYILITNHNENGVNYYVADCMARDSNRLFTALATDQYPVQQEEVATVMAKRKGAVIAVNGDYFGSGDSGDPVTQHRNGKGVVIRNGQLYRKTPWYDICAVFKDGTMRTFSKSDITADALKANDCWQAWNFGPSLLDSSGKAYPDDQMTKRPPTYNPVNPRTGIGYLGPNHFVLVVVDGVRNGINVGLSKGMRTSEFAKVFEDLGCKCAYNLDGGGSSVMVFMGNVISHPCDQGIGNQRAMSDIIYFGESETDQANIARMGNN